MESGGGGGGGGSGAEVEPQRLSELLESGWRLLEEAESGAEASSGAAAVQRKVQQGIGLLERAASAVAELQLFSRNEELDEVASADLRFMLVPALLAALVLKQQPGSSAAAAEKRLEHLRRARSLFLDFLRLCTDYGIGPAEMPANEPGEPRRQEGGGGGLEAAAARRQAKIERYKQKKEVENQLASLKALIDGGQAEEEQQREFYLLQIKKWVSTSLEEIESIDQEIEILSQRDVLKQRSAAPPGYPSQPPPLKPFILTRDAAQAKVFGAGYPSLATMTVDDWYQQHRQQGAWPDQGTSQKASGTEEQQKEQEEEKTEAEEEKALQKKREWDDWKDLHPRGYGNRKNMG